MDRWTSSITRLLPAVRMTSRGNALSGTLFALSTHFSLSKLSQAGRPRMPRKLARTLPSLCSSSMTALGSGISKGRSVPPAVGANTVKICKGAVSEAPGPPGSSGDGLPAGVALCGAADDSCLLGASMFLEAAPVPAIGVGLVLMVEPLFCDASDPLAGLGVSGVFEYVLSAGSVRVVMFERAEALWSSPSFS